MNFNPYRPPHAAAPNVAGKGQIENPGQAVNMVWQQRAAEPSEYENALADSLERAFEGGAQTLEDVVASLNSQGCCAADGRTWSAAAFEAEMARLGGAVIEGSNA